MIKKEIISSRVNIEYLDQNEEFASILPRSGLIVQRQKTIDGANNWFVVELDEPFEYQIKIKEPFQFTQLYCRKLLIRSRWENHEVGKSEETSVFILLIPDETLLNSETINIDEFYHIAWGICKTINI